MVLGIKKEYCGVLHGSPGYYRVLSGTGVHCGVLFGTEGTRGTGGTDRHCGGTTEYWVVLEVLGSNRGVLWGTVGYGWVLLGVGGYWVGEY